MQHAEEALIEVIGLTGGIATGKSSVARLLTVRGFPVVDADALARDVVAPGSPGLARLVEAFGQEILGPNGALDRRRLGALAFADPEAKRRLEGIMHPMIAAASVQALAALAHAGHTVAFYEAALLVETGRAKGFPQVVVVATSPDVQRSRLREREPDLSEQEVDARIAAQLPLEDKLRAATHVIYNDGDHHTLERAVDAFIGSLGVRGEA